VGALDERGLAELYRTADLVVNHSGAQELLPQHVTIRNLLYLETDPVPIQVAVADGEPWTIHEMASHDLLYTYGLNLGAEDCLVPVDRFEWLTTLPAVCVDWWQSAITSAPRRALTTVATWRHDTHDVAWKGERWRWSKHIEFLRFADLPTRSALPLEVALAGAAEQDIRILRNHGWRVASAADMTGLDAYRRYIVESLGEFSIAKEQYVKPRTGWFSDRSAAYLAAGRPVVVQDTGIGRYLPVGEGLLTFATHDEALEAIESIATDPDRHAQAALEIAREYLATDRVIPPTLVRAGVL
jgi:hypothetical protein